MFRKTKPMDHFRDHLFTLCNKLQDSQQLRLSDDLKRRYQTAVSRLAVAAQESGWEVVFNLTDRLPTCTAPAMQHFGTLIGEIVQKMAVCADSRAFDDFLAMVRQKADKIQAAEPDPALMAATETLRGSVAALRQQITIKQAEYDRREQVKNRTLNELRDLVCEWQSRGGREEDVCHHPRFQTLNCEFEIEKSDMERLARDIGSMNDDIRNLEKQIALNEGLIRKQGTETTMTTILTTAGNADGETIIRVTEENDQLSGELATRYEIADAEEKPIRQRPLDPEVKALLGSQDKTETEQQKNGASSQFCFFKI